MSLMNKVIQKAEKEPGLHYRNPSVPHVCVIPGGLSIGTKIFVQGTVPKNPDRFAINLKRGSDPDSADIYFHFNPRFQDTACVVRNSYSGEWGEEERDGDSPFSPTMPFLVVISAFSNGYEVEVNGNTFTTFQHRDGLPLSNVTHLSITGDVIIQAIQIPIETLPKHLRLSIPGETKIGDMFYIRGEVSGDAERFIVNVQCGPGMADDVVFHFNPRFPDGVVVRNIRSDDTWGEEERDGNMPFTPGDAFDLVICAASDGFHTMVNGQEFIKFGHRLEMHKACTLYIEGDLAIKDVWINSTPTHLPPDFDDTPRDLQMSSLQHFVLQNDSAICRIPNGICPGSMLVISGVVDKEPSRFSVNLQCDSCEDADILYHFNPRWDDSEGEVLVQNSRDEGVWGEEIRTSEKFPFFPDSNFDIQILCQAENFRVAINGVFHVEFPYRLDLSRGDHVLVRGDVHIRRIVVV
ncbi:32 kDa beta-galactoside-binding lectin-like [Tachypleus tridentatus]|uniref:32 kDa beta-galactoside-binding lectin-like n=1 Tax=Tachypleus tridentatus TaxID=6853 RepID=UPI003FD34857